MSDSPVPAFRPFHRRIRLPGARLVDKARGQLRKGRVLAYSTESCFGLGCDPMNHRALARILGIKGRPNHKGMIVIASHIDQLRHLVAPLTEEAWQELMRYWPGHYTFLLPASPRVPPVLRGRHAKLAVRLTAHDEAAALCHALGSALVSTSANRAGKRSLKTARACKKAFGDRVLTLPGRIGKRRRPSTIIDFESGRVLRA
ncbi:L-threonylcarbamoyladenylate synthase [Paludibacterium paludis]|nr:L-threonylcarbamoyladenylate synthase [Paludibacterium paludis]